MRKTKANAKPKRKHLPVVRVDFPSFSTEAEEAAWWDTHPEVLTEAFERAYGKPVATQSITLRLPVQDIAKARQVAMARGLRYQTLLKSILHEALAREKA